MKMEESLSNNSPIFIVGAPRSGTTLMRAILSAHPAIAIAPETQFFNDWVRPYSHLDITCSNNFQWFWEEFSKSKYFSSLGIESDATWARILAANARDYKTIFDSVLQEYAIKMKKRRWGEKTPAHDSYVDVLLRWYPQARIIWMFRDPRAVTASLLNAPWASQYTEVHAKKWRNTMGFFDQQWAEDMRVKLVQYEMLVTNPEFELRQVCRFIGEEYNSAMLFDRSKVSSPISSNSDWGKARQEAAIQPITNASLEKWRTSLSPTQIALVEHITWHGMLKHGYQPITEGLNRWQLIKFFWTKILRKVTKYHKNLLMRAVKS